MEKIMSSIELPYSTADCEEGPEILFRPGSLKLRYDTDSEDVWVTVIFCGAIAYRFIPDYCVTESMVAAYSKICIIENSDWIAELNQNSEFDFSPSIKHYSIFFDHNGYLEVLARSYDIT